MIRLLFLTLFVVFVIFMAEGKASCDSFALPQASIQLLTAIPTLIVKINELSDLLLISININY